MWRASMCPISLGHFGSVSRPRPPSVILPPHTRDAPHDAPSRRALAPLRARPVTCDSPSPSTPSISRTQARDRPLGRVCTLRSDTLSDGQPIDLGAAWVHGTHGNNPVARLARDRGVELLAAASSNPWTNPREVANPDVYAVFERGERVGVERARRAAKGFEALMQTLGRGGAALATASGDADRSFGAEMDALLAPASTRDDDDGTHEEPMREEERSLARLHVHLLETGEREVRER